VERVPTALARADDASANDRSTGPSSAASVSVASASVASASVDSAPALEEPPFREIRVPLGTTLTKLATDYYGDASPDTLRAIQRLNPTIADADHIRAGATLRLAPLEGRRNEVEKVNR